VLDFEATWTSDLPNLLPVFPTVCRTQPAYVAGPNEVAIVNINGSAAPSQIITNNTLDLKVAMSQNGGEFSAVSLLLFNSMDDMSGFAPAHVSTTKRIELTEGTSYVFGAQFRSGAAVTLGLAICQGTVMIVRQ